MNAPFKNDSEPIGDVFALKERIRELELSLELSVRSETVLRESEAQWGACGIRTRSSAAKTNGPAGFPSTCPYDARRPGSSLHQPRKRNFAFGPMISTRRTEKQEMIPRPIQAAA